MAKKARKRIEELEELEAFRFPDFDERKFLAHEYEQTIATGVGVLIAVGLAVADWAISKVGAPVLIPWLVGIVGVVAVPYLVGAVRPLSKDYTKGDWGWLILTVFMGWIGLWFLFLNLFPTL